MVVDQETQASYTSLQAAEVAASPGDTLSAIGTCTGTTVITKNLTITGGATLDGGHAGSVLTIEPGVTLTISSLTIHQRQHRRHRWRRHLQLLRHGDAERRQPRQRQHAGQLRAARQRAWLQRLAEDAAGRGAGARLRRGEHMKAGFAFHLVTVRWLGTFLEDPLDLPGAVLDFVAGQLGISDPSPVKNAERANIRFGPFRSFLCKSHTPGVTSGAWPGRAGG
jgi:hypothetical protein